MEHDRVQLARGMADWLSAGGSLALGPDEVRVLCGEVLGDLLAWLREGGDAPRRHARALLPGDRLTILAGSFTSEFLKTEGLLEGMSRGACREVTDALDAFFTGPLDPEPGGGEARHNQLPKKCVSGSSHPVDPGGTGA